MITPDEDYYEGHPEVTVLDDNVVVIHNVLSDPDDYINVAEATSKWTGWYGFGKQVEVSAANFRSEVDFPSWDQWHQMMSLPPESYTNYNKYDIEIALAFHKGTKFYIEKTGRVLDTWTSAPWGLAMYSPDDDHIGNDTLTMVHHTDYVAKESDKPGPKFGITAVLYSNDDYEGGDISFRVVDGWDVVKEFSYKPKAGDMVIFPSNHPYYHGVRRVYGSPKYITRLYWLYDYHGSPEWFALKDKYGEEKFIELEEQRFKRHDLMIGEPVLRPACSMSTYYKLLDSGELLDDYTGMDLRGVLE